MNSYREFVTSIGFYSSELTEPRILISDHVELLRKIEMSISKINKSRLATNVHFSNSKMVVLLEDGRELSVPLEWFKRLRDATKEQLEN